MTAAGLGMILVALGLTLAPRASSIQVETAPPQVRTIMVLSYDEAFLFAGRHYDDGSDPARSTEPALLVHSKAADRWLQITAIPTVSQR